LPKVPEEMKFDFQNDLWAMTLCFFSSEFGIFYFLGRGWKKHATLDIYPRSTYQKASITNSITANKPGIKRSQHFSGCATIFAVDCNATSLQGQAREYSRRRLLKDPIGIATIDALQG
jgi:hypothetical protein